MASFELIDQIGAVAPGPWHARPPEGASFGARGEQTGPVWLVDLPSNRAAALRALDAAEASLRRHEAALAATPERINALAAAGGGASFGIDGLPNPERLLLATLGELRDEAPGPAGEAFGAGSGAGPAWVEAAERLRAFVAQVQDTIGHYAVVETRIEGLLVARTSVSLTGDLRSLLGVAPPEGHVALHRRSLGLALRSRAALLKTFGTVMRGAAIVATMVSSPAGAALALPAAWRFVEQLLGELRGP